MLYALNDILASFVFIDCIIVWIFMLKCVLRVRIKIYIYIYRVNLYFWMYTNNTNTYIPILWKIELNETIL